MSRDNVVSIKPEPEDINVPASIAEIAASPDLTPQEAGDQSQPPVDGIRAFDEQGREILVPREEWSTNVLPNMILQAWDQPDQLYMVILNSLNDGFATEVIAAAEHLAETDTIPARGACMWGIVLLQQGRLDEAESLLAGFTEKNGEDASVLTNLAKVYAAQDKQELTESTLWRALELEPNLDNGLGWYASMAQERGGDQAAADALERIRQLPGSWRAQLWLARGLLNGNNLDGAKVYYNEALERAPKPIPGDFLMQMSGDLGGHGYLRELLEFTIPHFVPELHGLAVGNNLIKACIDTGNLDPADEIRRALDAFNRPDWRQPLAFWDQEIGRQRAARAAGTQPGTAQDVQLGMLRVDGPIWLPLQSPARKLFGQKTTAGPSVTFLGGTAEAPEEAQTAPTSPEAAQSMAETLDALGRLTRALPLFLAEQVEMLAAASGRAMLPWAVGAPGRAGGFVVSGQRWPDEVAVQSANADANKSDYVVSVHIDAEVEPWTADLAFVRTSDGTRIGELSQEFNVANPEEGLRALAAETIELLGAASWSGDSAQYHVPDATDFTAYLQRLEQLLALRCAGMEGVPPQFLNGEREIMNGALDLARAEPHNMVARVLLIETLVAMRPIRPELAQEFAQQVEALATTHPLPTVTAAFSA
ncbi:tetratricopeptide repeat protein [Granulicella tundricola]|uniref:Tetratricopeptide TPR_1 repeat-containing protein n=1 Tax=Granulicella tundricola (strain ATCC BAA-1859 / DSM 23138 / MP5ACTX9) TaxID=1198114 RepID=E8WW56_GRATM|nr:hypothetical protein [Granulicella tundricola]ADW67362.1 Tetratricopeptide TPR_1 repeat-containing protein [Granulicella tundricola MP5ACTX9]